MAKRSRLRTQKNTGRRLVLAILLVCLVISGYWIYVNQIRIRQYVQSLLQKGRDVSSTETVTRGVIYDRNLRELAVSMDRVSVYATVRELESLKETAMRLAPALKTSEDSLFEKLKGGSLQVWLAENISQEEEDAVRKLNLKGIFLHKEKVRYYPQKEKAAHFLGYAENQMGLTGLEYTYNLWLNQYGTFNRPDRESAGAPGDKGPDGHNLVLTVDLKIQDILEKYITDVGAREGMRLGAMVVEARSGKVIGFVNYPSYDPNHFRGYKRSVLDNIFVEPVAVPENFRSFLMDVASIQSEKDNDGQILPWSVSSGGTTIGSELRLWERLGLNDTPHLDFVADNDKPQGLKLLTQEHRWGRNDTTVPTIATPIQILTALTRILNGGLKVTPHMVDSEKNPRAVRSDTGKDDIALRKEVSGEAQNLFASSTQGGPLSSGYLVGDGLAYSMKGSSDDYLRNQMMAAVIPAKGAELILFVVVDAAGLDPAGSGKAGSPDLVSPAMKMVYPLVTLQQVLTHLFDMMTAEEKEKMNFPGLQLKKNNAPKAAEPQEESKAQVKMPDLRGLSLRKSLRLLKGTSVEIRVYGTGRVVAQTPAAGTPLTDVKECILTLQLKVNKDRPGKEVSRIVKKSETGKGNETRK